MGNKQNNPVDLGANVLAQVHFLQLKAVTTKVSASAGQAYKGNKHGRYTTCKVMIIIEGLTTL